MAAESHTAQAADKEDRKRIVVCCDGTWMDADGSVQVPSNVTRFMRAISPVGKDPVTGAPISQISYYHNGVGTGAPSLWNQYIGGATGEGMGLNIREAYSFICANYRDGDEIFLIGFSRGAFTARSISSLISQVGLLTRKGMRYSVQIFDDWEYQIKPGWTTKYPDEPYLNRPTFASGNYMKDLASRKLTRPNIPIKCVGVWDTVGALGIPRIAVLPQPENKDFAFVDTEVAENIEYAFHAMALDEKRRSYHPTVWEQKDPAVGPKVLKQTWFAGVHSDIGGSYSNDDMATLTLAWLCGQLDEHKLLQFSDDYIYYLVKDTLDFHAMAMGERSTDSDLANNSVNMTRAKSFGALRQWGMGKIHDSMTPFFKLGGTRVRTPMEYTRVDPISHEATNQYLANTNEHMHPSVRVRMGKAGLGYDDKGKYEPPSLDGWSYAAHTSETDTPIEPSMGDVGKLKNVVWTKTLRASKGKKAVVLTMPEDKLTKIERQVLRRWTGVHDAWEDTADARETNALGTRLKGRETKFGLSLDTRVRTETDLGNLDARSARLEVDEDELDSKMSNVRVESREVPNGQTVATS